MLFLFCSCPPGPKPEEEAKTYKITLKNGESTQELYYKGSSWYSDESCTTKVDKITPEPSVEYKITYDLNDKRSTPVEGCTPSNITDDKYTKATKSFMGYFYNETQIVDGTTGRLLTISNINADLEAETKFNTDSISLPTDIRSATKSFVGWSLNEDRSGDALTSSFTPTSENTTLYAVWKEQDGMNVYFEVEGKSELIIKVGDDEVSTSNSYKTAKGGNFVFSISNDETFELKKVEYKAIGEASYSEITSTSENYTISTINKNIIVKITVEVKGVAISFGYSSTENGENNYIKYMTTSGENITSSPINVSLGEDYSFKVVNSYPYNIYNVKVLLGNGTESEELLHNEEGIYTIKKEYLLANVSNEITIKSQFLRAMVFYVGSTVFKDVLNVRRVVGEQNVLMPLTWDEEYTTLAGRISKGEELSFKIEPKDTTQYEVTGLAFDYMNASGEWRGDGEEYLSGPDTNGVYTIDVGSDWQSIDMTVYLKTLAVPLTFNIDDIEVFDAETSNVLTTLLANKSANIIVKPKDTSKVVSSIDVNYRSFNYDSQRYERATKTLSNLRNASGNNVYTLSEDMTTDEVKITATLVSKSISLSKSGDSITWTPTVGSEFPSTIDRYSYLSFKVEPTESGKVIDEVTVTYGGTTTTTLLPNENGIYTLTPDMTAADSITLSATASEPSKDITITFKSDGAGKATFKDSSSNPITDSVSSKEKTEYEFTVEAVDSNTEVESVFAIYNGKQLELKPTNGKYALSKYITASNVEVVAKIRYKSVTLTPDNNSNYTFTPVSGETFATSLTYHSEYKFKVENKDNTKKITRIKVLTGATSQIPIDYLYKDSNDVYTLPSDDVTNNIRLVVDTANATGTSVTVIGKGETTTVSSSSDKIPYVLITNFSPSDTYASEALKYDETTKDPWDKVRSNNIYSYSLSPNGATTQSLATPRTVSTMSAPSIENGKVVWRNFVFNYGNSSKNIKDYEEVYTDVNNKIIYLVSTKDGGNTQYSYSAAEDSPIRALINYMYSDPESSVKMPSDLLATLQKNVATPSDTFPNKNYLFDKSTTDRGYFFVMIDYFGDRGWNSSTGGYFSSSIYSGSTDNAPYAAFYLNTNSSFTGGKDIAAETITNLYGIADNFVSTLSHEYTHYLEADYKHTQNFENTGSLHFLSEGYANYNAAKGTKDTTYGGKIGVYMSELLGGHKIYDPKDSDDTSYGLGHLFFMYIEEKYGKDMPSKIMADDKAVFKAIEDQTGKKFGELYNDFILNLIFSGYTDTVTINGVSYGDMSFAKYTEWDSSIQPWGDYAEQHGFESVYSEVSRNVKNSPNKVVEDGVNIYNDVKMILDSTEGISSSIGEMSFRLVCYPNGVPNTLTLSSESSFIKAYLFYSDKKPQ